MKPSSLLLLCAAALVASGSVPATKSQEPAVAPLPSPEKRTIAAMHDLGNALYAWLTDRMNATPAEEGKRLSKEARAVEQEAGPRVRGVYVWGWRPLRSLSHEEVVGLLRPASGAAYIEEIPLVDGWGRPLELTGWPENVYNAEVFAIRSAGPNGRFEGPRYQKGTWAVGAEGDDIVWVDGFFVRWPGTETPPLP